MAIIITRVPEVRCCHVKLYRKERARKGRGIDVGGDENVCWGMQSTSLETAKKKRDTYRKRGNVRR